MRWLVLACTALAAAGCEPTYLQTSAEVDTFLSQGRYSAVCVAFKNDGDDTLREYAARQLARYVEEPVASECLCEAITSYKHGPYDSAVLTGLAGVKSDAMVACAEPAFDKAEGEDRERLVVQIGDLGAPASYARLAEIAAQTSEPPGVRAAAVRGLMPVRDEQRALLLARLVDDPDPSVRAAVAETLENSEDPTTVKALVKAAGDDADGQVRAAALRAVVKLRIPETDQMVCTAMIEDPDERVRDRAVRSFKGSKRPEALACLERRLKTHEASAVVRESTLTAIYASPNPKAPKILCDNVGPFLRMYVDELPVTRMDGADIMKFQNNRDYENSLACVQRARSQGGYSCWAQYYLAVWANDLGGSAHKPTCKGMEPAEMVIE